MSVRGSLLSCISMTVQTVTKIWWWQDGQSRKLPRCRLETVRALPPPCGQRRSRRYARHASSVAKRCRAARPVRWVSRTPRRRPSAEAVRPR